MLTTGHLNEGKIIQEIGCLKQGEGICSKGAYFQEFRYAANGGEGFSGSPPAGHHNGRTWFSSLASNTLHVKWIING